MRGGVRGERPEEVYGAPIGGRFEIPNGRQLAEGGDERGYGRPVVTEDHRATLEVVEEFGGDGGVVSLGNVGRRREGGGMSARFRNGRTHAAEVTRTNGREGGGGGEIARTIGGSSAASISSDGFDRDRLSARAPEGTRAAARLPAIRARPFLRDKGTTRVIIRFAKTGLRLGAGSSNSRSRESNVRPIRISIQRPKTVEIGASRELRPLLVGSRRGDRAGAAGQAPRGSGRSVVVVTMVRHSKNAGTMGSEGLRYHERRALGFGTVKERLGAETVKNFDACALSLSHATDPVVTPEGVLYDREHILRCLLHQKKDIARKLKAGRSRRLATRRRRTRRRPGRAARHWSASTATITAATASLLAQRGIITSIPTQSPRIPATTPSTTPR